MKIIIVISKTEYDIGGCNVLQVHVAGSIDKDSSYRHNLTILQ